MARHKLEFDTKCSACRATGLYVGMAERDGAAVICSRCKGTGCHRLVIKYEDFEGRKPRERVERVYRTNPGICIANGNGYTLEDFGGIPYEAWVAGEGFPPGTENRRSTCPAWFYQCADDSKKPDWEECLPCGAFSSCKQFPNKHRCWERWDKEFAK